MSGALLLVVQAAAFWPVWRWYADRLSASGEAAGALLALAAALVITLRRAQRAVPSSGRLTAPAGATLLYALSVPILPPLFQGALAFLALVLTAHAVTAGPRLDAGPAGLALLALPIVPHLDFWLGLPLRLVTANGARLLLGLAGADVTLEGTCFRFHGRLVAVDAPCSGVRMLWTALFLAFVLAALARASWRRTAALALLAVVAALVGNALRAALLFWPEAGIVAVPAWFHDAAGLIVFALLAAVLVRVARRFRRAARCAPSSSS